ncbi:MAG: hypothetical protein PUC32_03620 [Oscillospiraceae bacterium]|nr:hypothetical protein [Oscillospiraceae bacterium]
MRYNKGSEGKEPEGRPELTTHAPNREKIPLSEASEDPATSILAAGFFWLSCAAAAT